jgi:CHASE3 domain sensor protein
MKRVSLFSRLSLVGRVVVLASAVAMVVVLVVAAALIAIISLRRAEARESRAKDVTTATLRVENIAFDLESSSRGYTLTGDRRFITLFYAARAGMPVAVGRLKKLVADDPEQFRRAREAEGLMRRYVTDYALPLIAIRTAFPEIARVQTATDEDRRRATEIRDTLGNILAVEQQRSAARSRQASEVA